MNRKNLLKGIGRGLLIGIVIVIVVVAIGGGLGYYYTTVSHSSVVTITYYDDLSPSEASTFDNVIIPQFEQQHPNVKINLVSEDAGSIVSNIQSLEKANDVGATVIAEDNMVIGELLYSGDLMNLTPYSANISIPSMIPSMSNLMQYEQKVYHGVYFIPFRGNIPLVWYNKTVFEKFNLSIPQNWDDLMNVAQVIYQKSGVKPIMFQGGGSDSTATELYQWMVQAGGNPFLFNDSGDVKAFTYLDELSQYFAPGYTQAYWGTYQGLFGNEYYILDYQWPYIYATAKSEGLNVSAIGFYPGPAGLVNSAHLVGGDVLAIPKGATHLPELLLFVRFLLSVEVQKDIIMLLGEPAVNQQAYQNLPSNISALFEVEEQAFQNAFFREPVPWISYWNTIADQVFVQIVEDHAPVSEIPSILSHANAQMYQYLASTYNTTVAQEYEQGMFAPLYG